MTILYFKILKKIDTIVGQVFHDRSQDISFLEKSHKYRNDHLKIRKELLKYH